MSRFARWFLINVGLQSILVIGIVWFGFLLVEDVYVRWDLTEDERFTISDASHDLVANLPSKLEIHVYMSKNVPPRYQPLQRQVLDVLSEYEAASGGKVEVKQHDPDESTKAKNEADNHNIPPVRLPVYEATSVSVLQVYGGIVLTYGTKSSEVINFAARYMQGYEGLSSLEYELSSKIWQLTHEKPKLGLTGYLATMPRMPMGPRGRQPQPKFQGLRALLGEAFEIENVDLNQGQPDPAKIPLLLIVRPKDFSDVEVFRLDQYLMQGGRVILFVTKGEIGGSQWSPTLSWQPFKTGLDSWLGAMGVRVPDQFVVHLDTANMIEVDMPVPGNPNLRIRQQVPSIFRPRITSDDSFNKDNPAVQTLKQVALFWAHPIDILADKVGQAPGVEATVLIKSHKEESWRWKDMGRVDMRVVTRADVPQRSEMVASPVCVALEGSFRSYFADRGAPPSLTPAEENKDGEEDGEDKEGDEKKDENTDKKKDEQPKGPTIIKQSTKKGYLVVVGNSIFISDDLLRRDRNGQVSPAAREATLLAFNLVDWLARSEALIALRAKQFSNRQLVDEAFKEEVEAVIARAKDGDITEEKYRELIDEARDKRKARRRRWRWINIIVPSFLIIAAGALAWILRAALRARTFSIPTGVPPEGISES